MNVEEDIIQVQVLQQIPAQTVSSNKALARFDSHFDPESMKQLMGNRKLPETTPPGGLVGSSEVFALAEPELATTTVETDATDGASDEASGRTSERA